MLHWSQTKPTEHIDSECWTWYYYSSCCIFRMVSNASLFLFYYSSKENIKNLYYFKMIQFYFIISFYFYFWLLRLHYQGWIAAILGAVFNSIFIYTNRCSISIFFWCYNCCRFRRSRCRCWSFFLFFCKKWLPLQPSFLKSLFLFFIIYLFY
jgi:hypothetical protein